MHSKALTSSLVISLGILFILTTIFYLEQRKDTVEKQTENQLSEELIVKIVSEAPKRGQLTNGLRVIEFSDFTCIHCKEFSTVIEKVLPNYPDIQHIWFHAYSADNEQAKNAAIASECAHQQGKFWEYHDELFVTQIMTIASLNQIADKVELDKKQFQSCIENKTTSEKMKEALDFAQLNQIKETPTTLLEMISLKET